MCLLVSVVISTQTKGDWVLIPVLCCVFASDKIQEESAQQATISKENLIGGKKIVKGPETRVFARAR